MATVNQTASVGPTQTAVETDLARPAERPFVREATRTEYRSVEDQRQVAEAGEIRPVSNRPTLDDFERLKKLLNVLEKKLGGLADARAVARGRAEKGLLKFAESLIGNSRSNPTAREEVRRLIAEIRAQQAEMERGRSLERPGVADDVRREIALSRLQRMAGTLKIQLTDARDDPARLRASVIGGFRARLVKLGEGKQRLLAEIRRWEKVRDTGTAEEKAKAEQMLTALRVEERRFIQAEGNFSRGIVHAENWIRELEKEEFRKELNLAPEEEIGDSPEGTSSSPEIAADAEVHDGGRPAASGDALLGIASAPNGDPAARYEAGTSDYVQVDGTVGIASASGPLVDVTGTNLAVIQSSGQVREEWQRSRRVVSELLRRLAAGDLRVIDLALIMVAHQTAMTTANVGAKMIKALDAMDKSQAEIVKKLEKLNAGDSNFSSQTASLNIQSNKLAVDRNSVMSLLRTAVTGMEEAQNTAKSFLDVQGAQLRYLSRWNT